MSDDQKSCNALKRIYHTDFKTYEKGSFEYEGGELQLMNSANPITIQKKKGHIVVFPSYMLHKVTPVTVGKRKSLVIWIAGPPFK